MKKISVLLIAFVTLAFSSCSSDDNGNSTASIVGKWEYTQTGEVIEGVEVLETYDHTAGCDKDYMEFKSDGTFDDVWYSNGTSGCTSDNDSGTWAQNGTTITTAYGEQDPEEGEILILNETTLKVRFVDTSEGMTETYVTVLTRQ
jgi:Lipocalin-like domain